MVLCTYLERIYRRSTAKIVVELSFSHVVELIDFYLSEIKRAVIPACSNFSMEKRLVVSLITRIIKPAV